MFSDEVDMFIEDYKEKLAKAVEHYQNELSKIRAGRANPKMLERIMVDYYGTMTPLHHMSNISVPDPRVLLISLWDISMLKNVLKAIDEANLGLSPSDDGKSIRLNFPPLTEERRREIMKEVKELTENAKIASRNERRDVLDIFKNMKKNGEIEKEVQKILDANNLKIDSIFEIKEKEIMEI